ncbi:hypothetical protein BGZ83_007001 [Gryganskiella cystojenkinii]|nr:hypothetical protein BGZ83_007001 [Gryganskiella cystojenkinii]
MCKAIYALSGTLNLAIAFKENFILERTDVFLKALHTWQESGRTDPATLRSIFAGPTAETRRFSELMFPPVQFPLEEFKPYFEPVVPVPGQKAGYLFHRNRNGEWSRQYFYILPRGMLMQFSKGKDIHVANLNQTLLRTMNVDSRDFVFEICSIEIYLM